MAFTFTDQNFQSTVENSGVTVVDFWAEWCGPCKALGPIVEELADEFKGQALIGKLDVDTNPNSTAQFGIRNIPTVIILKDGKIFDKIIGLPTKVALKEKIDAALVVNA